MPGFQPNSGFPTPFGENEWRRSTQDIAYDSATCAAASVPNETIDGVVQKRLWKGEVMAKITSGADAGKVGPFMAGVSDGRQTLTNIVGINNTFLPWQLENRDVEIAYAYDAIAVQAWCTERDASGARIPLTDTTAAAMLAKKSLDITFK